ncbi:hypothetical protein CYY_006146 [Polysphondylium violaceum]|uniref:FNIP repeat-containing protein n=1 Tax=Polysphondylium violaceum TaxID=133409 RepID=A0A8J4PU00_9MYCE|nr:hypothetical protein CYY_006146 [Polysphondylium violaceum]
MSSSSKEASTTLITNKKSDTMLFYYNNPSQPFRFELIPSHFDNIDLQLVNCSVASDVVLSKVVRVTLKNSKLNNGQPFSSGFIPLGVKSVILDNVQVSVDVLPDSVVELETYNLGQKINIPVSVTSFKAINITPENVGPLPNSVVDVTLSFDPAPGFLPSSVTKFVSTKPINVAALPTSVNDLRVNFGSHQTATIEHPSSTKNLEIWVDNGPFPKIRKSIESLRLVSILGSELTNELPSNLESLHIENLRNSPGKLPSNLKKLRLVFSEEATFDLPTGFLPTQLEELKISSNYKSSKVIPNFYPSTLTKLSLSDLKEDYGAEERILPAGTIPSSVIELELNLYCELVSGSIPSSVKYLKLGKNVKKFNFALLPDSVERLILHDNFYASEIARFPANLTHLSIYIDGSKPATTLPEGLTHLVLQRSVEDQPIPSTVSFLQIDFNPKSQIPDHIRQLRLVISDYYTNFTDLQSNYFPSSLVAVNFQSNKDNSPVFNVPISVTSISKRINPNLSNFGVEFNYIPFFNSFDCFRNDFSL